MTDSKPNKRTVGRPKDAEAAAARDALVAAAAELFSRQGYAATKISALAKKAKVTPAMVHYYFGGKENLAAAVLKEAVEPLITQMEEIDTLEEWVTAFHDLLLKNRWLPHLMHREILTAEGHLTEMFQAEYVPRIVPKWFALMGAEKAAGRLRPEIDEFRHIIFLIATLVHPFMIAQLRTPFHDGEFSDEDLRAFRDDALAMFRRGTAPSQGY